MHLYLVLIPFIASLALNLPLGRIGKGLSFTVAWVLFLLQMASVLFPVFGLQDIDTLSRVVLFCIAMVAFVSLFASRSFSGSSDNKFNFINVLLLAVAGMNGVTLAKDIFSLYVFLEITAVASFILIAFDKEELGLEGAFKYIVLSGIATALMLAGIALLFLVTGSTNFSVIHSALLGHPSPLVNLAIVLLICALCIKSGLMPFHGWLPDAYTAAPAAVSVFLAGAVTKVAGVYAMIRIFLSIGALSPAVKGVLLFIGALSAVVAAVAALTQTDFKRMLSYSSISQVGYIILGLGSGTVLGLAGAALHIFNHAVFKSLLFVNSAAVESRLNSRDISRMSGLGNQMPMTGLTSVLGSLSCAGIPPLAGFWSKLVIIIALWLAGFKLYAVIAILASLLTLAYFLSLQRSVFFGKLNAELSHIKEARLSLVLPAVLLGAVIVGIGIATPLFLNKFILSFSAILGG